MNRNTIEIKYQSCNLCDALHRNINDNFESVSFDILDNGEIQVKIVLEKKTTIEEEYIDDIIAEYSSMQKNDCILKPLIEIGYKISTLSNLVYQKISPVLVQANY